MEQKNTTNNTPPPSLAGDMAILVVFLLVGGFLFAAYLVGSRFTGSAPAPTRAVTALPTETRNPLLHAQATISITPPPEITNGPTELGGSALPSILPSNTPRSYRSPTPRPFVFPTTVPFRTLPVYRSPTPYRTRTPTRTVTSTPTITRTITETPTITDVPSLTSTVTLTLTATPTLTLTPTVTATVTPVTACATMTPGPAAISPDGDTWIEQANATINHGADPTLPLETSGGGDKRVLIHFNSSLLGSTPVTTATLYIYILDASSQVPIFIHTLGGAPLFIQDEATWKKANITATWAADGAEGNYDPANFLILKPDTSPCWVAVDVTGIVNKWIGPTANTNGGLILIARGADGLTATIASQENISGSFGAKLELTR